MLRKWEEIPEWMKTPEVKRYYDILAKKKISLKLKQLFDFCAACILFVILSPVMLILSALIVLDSPGGIFYRQVRVTAYGRKFRIHKFRTMVADADKIGSQITIGNDRRITRIGHLLRKYRLDELPQLIDILQGNMSFVGTRPEVAEYVKRYSSEMKATLLLPAGVTSEASIRYKEEAVLLEHADNADQVYIETILPEKMKYNLEAMEKFNFFTEIVTMIRTVLAVLGKRYE